MGKTLRELLDARVEKKWDSFSWTTQRALVSSLNHVINLKAPHLVGDIRAAWMCRQGTPEIIQRREDGAFVVLGDPGEQDASQFVVVPALREVLSGEDAPAFMLICSDVIYPSGDVNDYVDGFYVPYDEIRTTPVYALPGNHDWYDGLAGCMWHFCRSGALPATVYGGRGSPVEWVCRLLWRRPSSPKRRLHLSAHRTCRFPAGRLQTTPYFAIDTRHVRVVCIDSGITGEIDDAQARWLLSVSDDGIDGGPARPKVLLTGKPLLVDRQWKRGCFEAPVSNEAGERFRSVEDVVSLEAHRYVAAIGGDIHNFQHYDRSSDDRQLHYVVAGGGGAFTSATHPLAVMDEDAPYPKKLFPAEGRSLRHFARVLLPRLWRLVRSILLVLAGLAISGLWVLLGDDDARRRDVLEYAAIGLAAWFLLRSLLPTTWRRTSRFRFLVGVVALGLGFAWGLAGWWLAPGRFGESLAGWAGLTGGGVLLAIVLRGTHWWRPRVEGVVVHRAWLLLVPALVAGTAFAFVEDAVLGVAAAATLVVALVTWALRAWGWWTPLAALLVALLVQAGDALVVLERCVVPDGAHGAFWAGVLGVVGGLLLVALVALLATPLLALVASWLRGLLSGSTRDAWGRVGRPLQNLLPLLVVGAACLLGLLLHAWLSTDPWRTAMTAGVVLPVVIGAVFVVDWSRRHARWGFSSIDALGIAVALFVLGRAGAIRGGIGWTLAALAALVAFGDLAWLRGTLRAASYKQDLAVLAAAALALLWTFDVHETWVPRAAAAAVVVLLAILMGMAIVHLVFIGAHTMVFDRQTHREGEQL